MWRVVLTVPVRPAVFTIAMLLLVLIPADGTWAQPPLKWCSLSRNVSGYGFIRTTRVDLNKDGVAEVVISYASGTGFSTGPSGAEAVFPHVFVYQAPGSAGGEVEVSVALRVPFGTDAARLEGQGCTANVKESLRASEREAAFFRPDSAFGSAFLGFYRKYGATEAQLTSLIPRYRCGNPPQCNSWEAALVPPELELKEVSPTTSPTPVVTPAPTPSP